MLGRQVPDVMDARDPGVEVRDQTDAGVEEPGDAGDDADQQPEAPVMPAPPFLTFQSRPTLSHQTPGVGFESGRDSRAR